MKKILLLLFLCFAFFTCKKEQSCAVDPTEQAAKDMATIQNYIKNNNISNVQSLSSGIYYKVLETGTGAKPTLNSNITIHYKGYLVDGTVFDQTRTVPAEFLLSRLIVGWQIGIPLIGAGGKIQLFVPSALGYGSIDNSRIPCNSVLIFDIELLSFK